MAADSPGRLGTACDICAGERLPAGLPRTCPDTLSVPGGQGVAGSYPAVPTKFPQVRVVFSGVRDGPDGCLGTTSLTGSKRSSESGRAWSELAPIG
jgi:hypothetical protein